MEVTGLLAWHHTQVNPRTHHRGGGEWLRNHGEEHQTTPGCRPVCGRDVTPEPGEEAAASDLRDPA